MKDERRREIIHLSSISEAFQVGLEDRRESCNHFSFMICCTTNHKSVMCAVPWEAAERVLGEIQGAQSSSPSLLSKSR